MKTLLFILSALLLFSCNKKPDTINLAGKWQFQADPDDRGMEEKWVSTILDDTIHLPGSMAESRKGFDISTETKWTASLLNEKWYENPNYAPYFDPDNFRFPYWLQPVKKYTGAAWYQTKVTIPENWQDKTVWLKLERPHWETTVWINDKKAGKQNSLATPHLFNISSLVKPGDYTISIRVDNRIKKVDPGINSHSITDHTQSNWNGMTGEITLFSTGKIYFSDVQVYPDVKTKSVQIKASIFNSFNTEVDAEITTDAKLKNRENSQKIKTSKSDYKIIPGENVVIIDYPLGNDALLWDEFDPNVYELSLEMNYSNGSDRKSVDFGLREFNANGTCFEINGRTVFLRGTLECAIFPLTGYPPCHISGWEKVFSAVKNHGLNHVRFHSWCPPEAAFEAADKMGVYLQVECSSWANQTTELGSGLPIDQYIWDESKRIVKEYGNHPSFVMMAYGNEPGGQKSVEFLTEFVQYWKNTDNRRVYTSGAGWPILDLNDYHNIPQPRIQGWGEGLKSIINAEPPKTDFDWKEKLPDDGIPVVSHEIGQWCVYPDFNEIEKYTGVLKPKNFEIFRESLNAHHLGNLADSFLLASGKLQALCYKADIEAALRTPGFAGFQLLDLHDFPGQGTALVGVLDAFWEEKGYITSQEFKRFCNSTVPLLRVEKRIFKEGETMNAAVELAHFGKEPLTAINPAWKLTTDEKTVAKGTLGQRYIPIGNAIKLGNVIYRFQPENKPRKLTLEVSVENYSNSWDIWTYPENIPDKMNEIRIEQNISASTITFLKKGGKVLLSLGQGKVAPDMGGQVGVGFSSIFWNTAWTNGQKPHTLGILCDPEHPALELFPTEYHSNWQWWDAMNHADAIQLDSLPVELKPIVRIIDDWVTNRRLALIFEAKVGDGSILICGADLTNNLDSRIETQQLKISLLNYMSGDKFRPQTELSEYQIRKIVKVN